MYISSNPVIDFSKLRRLTVDTIVADAYVDCKDRDELLWHARERLGTDAVMKIAEECSKSTKHYMGYPSNHIRLDVFVLTPEELYQLVNKAIEIGKDLEWRGY